MGICRSLQSLSFFLESKGVDERNAAGEAVALLCTMAGLTGADSDEGEGKSGRPFKRPYHFTLTYSICLYYKGQLAQVDVILLKVRDRKPEWEDSISLAA